MCAHVCVRGCARVRVGETRLIAVLCCAASSRGTVPRTPCVEGLQALLCRARDCDRSHASMHARTAHRRLASCVVSMSECDSSGIAATPCRSPPVCRPVLRHVGGQVDGHVGRCVSRHVCRQCADRWADMCVDTWIDKSVDLWADMCVHMRAEIKMCADMSVDA